MFAFLRLAKLTTSAPQCKAEADKAPASLAAAKSELKSWTDQLSDLRVILPLEITYNKFIKDDIPTARKTLEVHLASVPAASTKAQQVSPSPFLFRSEILQ